MAETMPETCETPVSPTVTGPNVPTREMNLESWTPTPECWMLNAECCYTTGSDMRTFVAITTPPSGPVPAFLDECRRRLDASRPDVKWVAAPHRHITLRFLGDVPGDSLEGVKDAIWRAALTCAPFEARLTGWGAFPGAFRPQTLWASVGAEDEALQRLEGALAEELRAIGFPPELKPFQPHITIGRARSSGGLNELARTLQTRCPPTERVTFPVAHLTLFESVLSPAGPRYAALFEAPLGAGQESETKITSPGRRPKEESRG